MSDSKEVPKNVDGASCPSRCSAVVENCAAILYKNDFPNCETITGQEKIIAIVHRLLGEIRQGSRDTHPKAAMLCHDLEIGLQEVLCTLRNAKAIVRSIASLDP